MNIAEAAAAPVAHPVPYKRNGKPGKISIQTFLEKYSQREDGYKYEYEDGYVIQSNYYAMTDPQQHIANNLTDFFYSLKFQAKVQGNLASEKDTWLTESKWRRPDMCYMSPLHVYQSSHGKRPRPDFVIEMVSPSDTAEYYDTKLDAYFNAGVKVVWLIYPQTEKVVIYHEDRSSVTRQGDAICSAAPVLPEFALPAGAIFKKPLKP